MYQIVIRILAPQISVFDFVFGKIVDGQFQPADCHHLPNDVLKYVQDSDLLGTQAFVKSADISALARVVLNAGADVSIYPNFVVFNLPESYVSKEEENAQ